VRARVCRSVCVGLCRFVFRSVRRTVCVGLCVYCAGLCEYVRLGLCEHCFCKSPKRGRIYSHFDLEFGRILIAKGDYTENVRRFGPIILT